MRYMQVYLDNLESAPAPDEVLEVLADNYKNHYGQAGTYHQFGQWSKSALECFAESAAKSLGQKGRPCTFAIGPKLPPVEDGTVLLSPLEHPAIERAAQKLGGEIAEIPLADWRYDLDFVAEKIGGGDVRLVVVSAADRVSGTLQPIGEIVRLCREREIPVFVDITAAFGRAEIEIPAEDGVYLYLRGRAVGAPADVIVGEKLDTDFPHQLAAGTSKALEIVAKSPEQIAHIKELGEYFWEMMQLHLPNLELMGAEPRAAGILSIAFEDVDRYALMVAADMQGVMAWAGDDFSAPIKPLVAAKVPLEVAEATLRFSFWRQNTREEIDYVLRVLPPLVDRVRFEKKSDKFYGKT